MSESSKLTALFAELLKRPESETLDFKRELYDFSDGDERADFTKDLICLANTPRESSAYIVFGVDWTPERGTTLHPLATQIDDVRVVDQVRAMPVVPTLNVRYWPVLWGGQHFGILEIPVQTHTGRPFLPTKTQGNQLKREQLYLRSGSKNVEATYDDHRRVDEFFGVSEARATKSEADEAGNWPLFLV